MALNFDRLADAIVDGIEAEFGFTWTAPQRANARKVWKVVAQQIIAEIDTNAEIQIQTNDLSIGTSPSISYVNPTTLTGRIG